MLNIKTTAMSDAETRIKGVSWIKEQLNRYIADPQNSDVETQEGLKERFKKADELTDEILDELIQ